MVTLDLNLPTSPQSADFTYVPEVLKAALCRTPLSAGLAQNVFNVTLDVALVLWLHWGVTGAATAAATAFYVGAGANMLPRFPTPHMPPNRLA